jgi:uncharacterized protein (TIGR03435 family)
MRYFVAALLIVSGAGASGAQTPAPAASAHFDVASVKPNKSPTPFGYYRPDPGRLTITNIPVMELAAMAYSMPMLRMDGPEWTRSERYDVIGTYDASKVERNGWGPMLQHLLEERFALRLHRETRSMPVYVLMKSRADGKLGPQLVSIAPCTATPPVSLECSLTFPASNTIQGPTNWAVASLRAHLEGSLRRTVVDETGLSGWFDMRLRWSADPAVDPQAASTPDPDRPILFTALQEQLGLKLVPAERPLEVIVIDHVEHAAAD